MSDLVSILAWFLAQGREQEKDIGISSVLKHLFSVCFHMIFNVS